MTMTSATLKKFGMSFEIYPFGGVVGHAVVKRSLLLLAIEPELRGVLVSASTAVEVSWLAKALGGLRQAHFAADPGFVELPINITEDQLLGALDLEKTISTGKRELSPGLLARANGQILVANDINLLDPGIATHLAQAVEHRKVQVEREGVCATQDADFELVGIFNSEEGSPNPLLRDRVALIVDVTAESELADKAEAAERAISFESQPVSFAKRFAADTARLTEEIKNAKALLPRVRASKTQLRMISESALRLGVQGNRADVFALKTARASAALAGRTKVVDDDLVAAIQLVLAPRATRLPYSSLEADVPAAAKSDQDVEENDHPKVEDREEDPTDFIEDLMIKALDTKLPDELLFSQSEIARESRGGKRFKGTLCERGRYVRSSIRKRSASRIAIDATLRTAAPYQRMRRAKRRLSALSGVTIEPSDLRYKELRHRTGVLFIFAVDASGSMAINRMAQAKGALIRLLHQAYLHRDKVALITFRGSDAQVLLPPTRSVELAKRSVDALPAGGGTPLTAGLVKAIETARRARLRGMTRVMLVLFTDGRANVALGGKSRSGIGDELTQLSAWLRAEDIRSVVVDTKSKFVSHGEAEALARTLEAHYVYLPRADAGAVYSAVSAIIRRLDES